ncbi:MULTISPECIES: DUF3878 family protein [Anaerostipes]|uniref:DUF3878 family protein n=1 Tax=Anaerostipes TaxID=207244 RepID=UPI00258E898A|nr:DUF3878 family protein [Anaerostipes sp.]MCI5623882.1 DUF3878 family protein [Anaerostipes sp.]
MNKDWEELEKYLAGLEPDMSPEFFRLAEIIKYQVLELCTNKNDSSGIYIPYMMNDALECYLVLENAGMSGEFLSDYKEELQAQLIKEKGRYVLILYQGTENVCTIWFEEIRQILKCYQYHEIGHFWVKGQEQWRQLVYMVGTIYEKYEYLGDDVCNSLEKELMGLIEFAPFRHWSPIREPLDDRYPATYEGITCMERLALEAGDMEFVKLLKVYRMFPFRKIENFLSKKMLSPKREPLYHCIYEKIQAASSAYPKRDYGERMNQQIQSKRENLDLKLKRKGYKGEYPLYRKGITTILATEEHPFTILDWDDFTFRIQLMVSECNRGNAGFNSGFFKGPGRKGWIKNPEKI